MRTDHLSCTKGGNVTKFYFCIYFFLIYFFKQFFVVVPFGSIFTIISKIFKLQIHEMVKVLSEACFCNFWNVHTLYTEFWTCPYILMGRGGQHPTTLYFSDLLLFFHSVIISLHSQAFNHVIRILLLSWVCSDPLHTQTYI